MTKQASRHCGNVATLALFFDRLRPCLLYTSDAADEAYDV